MNRQFFALGLAAAALTGLAMPQLASAQAILFEEPDSSSFDPMNLSSLLTSTDNIVAGGLTRDDAEDAYRIKLPAGKSVAICYRSKRINAPFLNLQVNSVGENFEHQALLPPRCSTGRRAVLSRSSLSRSGRIDTVDVKFSLEPNHGRLLNGRSVI
jgi:hypothetical protein